MGESHSWFAFSATRKGDVPGCVAGYEWIRPWSSRNGVVGKLPAQSQSAWSSLFWQRNPRWFVQGRVAQLAERLTLNQ